MRTRFQTIQKQHDGLLPGMIEVSIKRLGEPSIPCDYLAFLQLNSSLVGFTYEMGPLLRFHNTTQIRWRVRDFDSRTFVECLIGKATLDAAISEIGYIGSCIPPLRTLSIERSSRVCLIGPEDSRRVAQFWEPLLSHTVLLSDNVKKEASRHFEEHFGGLSPLVKKKSWERWIVLEMGTKMDERQAPRGNARDLERRLAASDREMWTPVLTAEA
ncbi:hypothetical protein K445DRAFT_28051 [Daldinia sp. EC12]|nr:hypothetical protein K445DRAFT_28051 [Daldinia sp. EC12]